MEDIILANGDPLFLAGSAPGGEKVLELLLGLLFLVAQGCCTFEILFLDRLFLLDLDLFDLAFDVLQFRRTRHGADART